MISSLWHSIVYRPLFNVLIVFINILPGHSVGGAIILLTVLVRLALFPLTGKSIRVQKAMKELEPKLKHVREKHKDDKQTQAKKTMELYQEHGVTPFSGCLPLFIQIPIIIGLYWVFLKGLKVIDPSVLYGFISAPSTLDMHFLVFDLAGKSAFLALCASVSQYVQATLSLGRQQAPTPTDASKPTMQEDFAKTMQFQMRYILPVMIGVIAYKATAAVALYWATSNILSVAQELWMRRSTKNNPTKLIA